MRPLRLGLLFGFLLTTAPLRADDAFFERSVRPVLADVCFRCHGGERTGGKLRVDSRAALLQGGKSGPALVPGDPDKSLLIRALRHADPAPAMPPGKQLPAAVVNDFARWVREGAEWPAGPVVGFVKRNHWAFNAPKKADPPPGPGATPVDRFLAARLRERGLEPNGPADPRALIRRLTFDLTGLPPTPEEVDAFLAAPPADRYERLVERLLASPTYGEKWGRHWLDVVRYADSAGETADYPVPDAWRYRNHVLDAFNADQPYDAFVREQVAGDLLAADLPPDAPPARRAGMITATGYLAIARRFGFDVQADHYLTLEDTIDVLGKSVLGLTVGCARCHDHKYDPVSQADYYALYGIFESTRYPFTGCEKDKRPRDLVALPPTPGPAPRPAGRAFAVAEGVPHDARLHERGDPALPKAVVPRRFLTVLGGQTLPGKAGSGRRELAGWLTERKNPLTARVLVNRVWAYHFGRGIVDTPSDFGSRGSPPSHPELLDWLAVRFMETGWSVKTLHRWIVCSDAYRRSSADNERNARLDPDNRALWRFARRRLQAEEIRDALLAVSGELDRSPGTAHPFPPEHTWGFTQHTPFQAVYDHNHRGVYLMTQRIKRHPFLALFDGADPASSTAQRHVTTVPTQALFFLNDPFVHARSERLADRLAAAPEAERMDRACRLLFGRPATPAEGAEAARFLADYAAALQGAEKERRALAAWLRVMLASNEFLHVD